MEIDKKEVLRYLGYKNQKFDKNIFDLIEVCCSEVSAICKERSVYGIFDIERKNDKIFLLGSTLILKNTDIRNHLANSDKCAVMAATLGIELESRIAYYSRFNITKGLIMDACANTAIENLCNELQTQIMEEALKDNLHITNRYSPGYGDFSIEIQRDILNVLEAYKKIGISVTENSLLLPRKSVTALIGLTKIVNTEPNYKCIHCKNEDCDFRKEVNIVRRKINFDNFLLFDGAMGTMLEKYGLRRGELPESYNIIHPEIIEKIHDEYFEAGCEVITTNTFGANSYKLKNSKYTVSEIVESAVSIAKRAAGDRFVALDIGPYWPVNGATWHVII